MVEQFKFGQIPEILYGIGTRNRIASIASKYGENVLLITGKTTLSVNSAAIEIYDSLQNEGFSIDHIIIGREPQPEDINLTVLNLKEAGIEVVIGIGGGSVIDAAKAISAMITVGGDISDYLEGVGTKEHPGTKIPFIAIPTTAGTGSEATKNAVITKPGEKGFKRSLRHDKFVPDYAVVDPELMLSCPPNITAASGMDAFTQLVESYLSNQSSPLTDALALDGIERIIRSLETAVKDGSNLDARSDIAYAALLSGITLANAGLGVIHGFAQPLGSLFSVPHGIVCGTLMGAANRATLQKLLMTYTNVPAINKYAKLGDMVVGQSGSNETMARSFIWYIDELTERLKLPRLSEFGIYEQNLDTIVLQTSLKNNPADLTKEELKSILKERI